MAQPIGDRGQGPSFRSSPVRAAGKGGPLVPVETFFLLKEDGDRLLKEDGDRILKEDAP